MKSLFCAPNVVVWLLRRCAVPLNQGAVCGLVGKSIC